MILALRARAVESGTVGLLERLIFAAAAIVMSVTWVYRAALGLARIFFGRGQYLRTRWFGLGPWTSTRDLPAPAAQSFRKWWKLRAGTK